MIRRVLPLLALMAACRSDRVALSPPRAEFLVAAGDSTFWVHAGRDGVRSRGSPIQLARYGGRFYEIYVVDDDRSYTDAEIIGQQVWRRDLITDDSVLLFRDTTIAGIERWYARAHPDDRPLDPDEDPDDDPRVSATSELDVLDQFGPYLSYEYRADLTVAGGDEWHTARRGVLDLKRGGDVTLARLFGRHDAGSLARRGATLFAAALDSVLASHDARAREAVDAIGDFAFDSTSFDVTDEDGAPAVEFAAPGRGTRGGGLILPLPPIRMNHPVPAWWSDVRSELPQKSDTSADRWVHGRYQIVARDQADGSVRLTVVDSAGHAWPVPPPAMPGPIHHIDWLDSPTVDAATMRALARAFDEAALYSDDARTAMARPHPYRTRSSARFANWP